MRVRLFRRRYSAVRIAFRRLLVRPVPRRHRHIDAGRRQYVRLTAGQSDPVARRLRVARRLTKQRAGGHGRRRCRSLVVVTCSCTATSHSVCTVLL